jgi:hypothetical protein
LTTCGAAGKRAGLGVKRLGRPRKNPDVPSAHVDEIMIAGDVAHYLLCDVVTIYRQPLFKFVTAARDQLFHFCAKQPVARDGKADHLDTFDSISLDLSGICKIGRVHKAVYKMGDN